MNTGTILSLISLPYLMIFGIGAYGFFFLEKK